MVHRRVTPSIKNFVKEKGHTGGMDAGWIPEKNVHVPTRFLKQMRNHCKLLLFSENL